MAKIYGWFGKAWECLSLEERKRTVSSIIESEDTEVLQWIWEKDNETTIRDHLRTKIMCSKKTELLRWLWSKRQDLNNCFRQQFVENAMETGDLTTLRYLFEQRPELNNATWVLVGRALIQNGNANTLKQLWDEWSILLNVHQELLIAEILRRTDPEILHWFKADVFRFNSETTREMLQEEIILRKTNVAKEYFVNSQALEELSPKICVILTEIIVNRGDEWEQDDLADRLFDMDQQKRKELVAEITKRGNPATLEWISELKKCWRD